MCVCVRVCARVCACVWACVCVRGCVYLRVNACERLEIGIPFSKIDAMWCLLAQVVTKAASTVVLGSSASSSNPDDAFTSSLVATR